MMEVAGKAVGVIGSIFLTVVISLWLQETILSVLATIIGGRFGKKRNLRGTWNSKYKYQSSDGGWKIDDPIFKVTLFGRYFFADGKSNIDGSTFRLRGRLTPENIIIGKWYEHTQKDRFYYGAFQLIWSPIEQRMSGRWLGHSRANVIKSGSWEWSKVPNKAN